VDLRAPSRPLPPNRGIWGLRAAAAGIAATALAATLATMTYRGIPGTHALDWTRLGPAIVLFVLVTGICIGTFVGLGTRWATRAGTRSLTRLVLGGAAGGAVGGIIPGFMGVAGFGSLHAPYLGTINIVSCVLAGATAFVVLWGPRLLPRQVARTIGPARRFGLATLAAVITVGGAGLLGGMLVMGLHWVPSLGGLRCTAHAIGLPSLGVATGLVLGTLGGGLVGLCCGIFGRLARHADPA